MFSSLPALLFLGLVAFALVAVLMMPKRRKPALPGQPSLMQSLPFQAAVPFQSPAQVSMRQQMLDEECEALRAAYVAKANEAWQAEVVAKVQGYFGQPAEAAEAKKK
jgi:uncharacterized membrane protein